MTTRCFALRRRGAQPVLAMVEDRLRREGVTIEAGGWEGSAANGGLDCQGLSRREHDVLELVAANRTEAASVFHANALR